MKTESKPYSYRLEPAIEEMLGKIAAENKLTKSMMLEWLIIEAARNMKLIPKDDPSVKLVSLFDWIREENIPAQEDYTKVVFQRIQSTPDALRMWQNAVEPRRGERAEKRQQFVNARIGKFCKLNIGWESDEEVVLPKNAGMLIKGYTRLREA